MQIDTRIKNLDLMTALQGYTDQRLRFTLGRFVSKVRRVTVRIADLNGPRGGQDKGCRIRVELVPTGHVEVRDVDTDLFAVIDRATDRIAKSVARELERAREFTGKNELKKVPFGSFREGPHNYGKEAPRWCKQWVRGRSIPTG